MPFSYRCSSGLQSFKEDSLRCARENLPTSTTTQTKTRLFSPSIPAPSRRPLPVQSKIIGQGVLVTHEQSHYLNIHYCIACVDNKSSNELFVCINSKAQIQATPGNSRWIAHNMTACHTDSEGRDNGKHRHNVVTILKDLYKSRWKHIDALYTWQDPVVWRLPSTLQEKALAREL